MRTYAVSVCSALLCVAPIATSACEQPGLPGTQSSQGVVSPARQHVPGEVIVQFRVGTIPERIHEITVATGSTIKKDLGAGAYLLSFSNERPVDELVARLRAYPDVLHAEPNQIIRIEPQRPFPDSKSVPLGK